MCLERDLCVLDPLRPSTIVIDAAGGDVQHMRNVYLKNGNLMRVASLEALPQVLSVPVHTLVASVDAFNSSARQRLDLEFVCGGDPYQQHLGDPNHAPNPCAGAIEVISFYAVAVYPAELGQW